MRVFLRDEEEGGDGRFTPPCLDLVTCEAMDDEAMIHTHLAVM